MSQVDKCNIYTYTHKYSYGKSQHDDGDNGDDDDRKWVDESGYKKKEGQKRNFEFTLNIDNVLH